MANLFPTPFAADLPENWAQGQIVSPNGTEVGLTQQYGYNYLMRLVNSLASGLNGVNANALLIALGAIPIANGGTGASTADTARENLNAFRRLPDYSGGGSIEIDEAVFDFVIARTDISEGLNSCINSYFSYVWQFFNQNVSESSERVQFAQGLRGDGIAVRYYSGTWSTWDKIATMSSLAEMVQSALQSGGVSVIRSIQRGIINIPIENTTATATINTVNTNKAIVVYGGTSISSGSGNTSIPHLVLTNSTTVTATRAVAQTSAVTTVPYQVIEFY